MKAIQPSIKRVYKPVTFFVLTFLVTWISWFLSAYFSFQENSESIFVLFMLPGLIGPFAIALWMIYSSGNKALKKNFVNKLFNLRLIKASAVPAILLIMPVAVVLSILIST
ncbi:MAG: CPBP family intramembrane metalloprotease, partial [Lentimicrobium sp.]|nr:CPBP family intramembrane metalloprotease [Lentimicrobium sp.]